MRPIPTGFHALLDYLTGLLLIASPWLFGFSWGGVATWLPVALGAGVIAYSAFTAYELAIVRVIPMLLHLWLDGLGGLLLAVSHWVFGFADRVWIPHLVIGVIEIGVALMTRTRPRTLPGRPNVTGPGAATDAGASIRAAAPANHH